ncbi:Major Facilitator Superfamily (MFS) transporter [Phytophthora megakarya]|uniref:Major Facilitator Superfamily (MFS) transporter n=1 Tax=Phytophthora megakarya TaxID=4795 RepID=A0A225WPB3_9STRA|nr:Major Facilitator Superfamily (MFS) transporter [Phytophthora megakarya]
MRRQGVEFESYVRQNSIPHSSRKLTHSVDARLNALEPRLSWFYIRLLLLTGVTWAIQAAVLCLFDYTRTLVAEDIGMGAKVLKFYNASIFLGSAVGGPIFGHVADSYGRRIALMIAMVFSLGGLAVSAAANAGYLLIAGRVITGIGFGGQLTSTVVLIQELTPRSMRGRMISLLDAFTGVGGLFGVLLAFAVAPWLEWRVTYVVACVLVFYTPVVWFAVPEGPRWLASVGRMEEAFDIVENIELVHCLQPPDGNVPRGHHGLASVLECPSSAVKLLHFKQLVPTLALWTMWVSIVVSSYGLIIYVPAFIGLSGGYNIFARWSTVSLLNIAQVAGSLATARVIDTYGSHRCFAILAPIAAVFAVVLSHLNWSQATVIVFTFLETALLAGCWNCILAYTPGHYSTTHRGRGMGYAVGVSKLAGAGATYLFPHMHNVWDLSTPALCWILGGVLAIVSVVIVIRYGYHQPANQEVNTDSIAWLPMGESVKFSINEMPSVGNAA